MAIMQDEDWDIFANFEKKEFECRHSGKCEMDFYFVQTLQLIRDALGFPLVINSGFRDASHPIEREKLKKPMSIRGEHTLGLAADISVAGRDALLLVEAALDYGIQRIGVKQSGVYNGRYIHVGAGNQEQGFHPCIWSY